MLDVPVGPDTGRARKQAEPLNDSGLMCLALMLQFNKLPADPDQIRREFAPVSGPMDTLSILRAAKALGLKARSVTVKARNAQKRLAKLPLPAITQTKDGNFFILGRVVDDAVLIQRPGHPPEKLSLDAYLEQASGEVILATTRVAAGGEDRHFDITWFIPAIYKYRKLFGEVLLASLFVQLFALVTPILFQVVMDKVLVHHSLMTLHVIVIAMLAIALFEILMGALRTYIFSHTTSRVDVELGTRLYRHLLGLPLAYFESRAVGQTVARVRELENIRDFITGQALTVVLDLLFVFVFLGVMYLYSPTLTYIVLGSIPFYALLSVTITPGLRRRIEEKFQRGARNQAFLTESVSAVETLKAMAVEPQMRGIWEGQLAGYVKASFRMVVLATVGSQGVQLISKITTALLLLFGAQLVIAGDLTVGELIAFNMLSGQVSGPVIRLAQLWQDFQQFRISLDRLGDVLNIPMEPGHNPNRPALPRVKGEITFDRINFRYRPGGVEVIRDLDIKIEAGEVVGIVGRSGSGKSTLTKLVQRLYVPERGRILVDGIDTAMVDPAWLRRQVGVVLQENILFNRSVRDNIALADPSLSMERVVAVAKIAGAHDFILELPDAYDTVLEERGSNLSGGQRQRIAIARALATDPRVLIFDEATSALDYESERTIQQNMAQITQDRTVLIVAHRLSTVRHADRIIVMDKGVVIEQGSHDALIQQDGIYAHLYRQQAG